MLDTDEVDDDYFTPVASTSLANIFGKSSLSEEKSENKTLKYTPPKPQVPPKPEETEAIVRVFACALIGHQWVNNDYTAKGKIGCAIVKIMKSDIYHMLLYDAKKTTLSSTALSSKLEVTVKEMEYISYYDSFEKYWSLYGSQDDIKKLLEYFKASQVNIKISTQYVTGPPQHETADNDEKIKHFSKTEVESDTDSSINRKTKASILNRMANMGHSVLPPMAISNDESNYSSDISETDNDTRPARHRSIVKRNVDQERTVETYKKVAQKVDNLTFNNPPLLENNQVMPLQSTSFNTASTGNNMNFFLTEQRINNSELRININRLSDKVDQIMSKINHLEYKSRNEGTANINNDILQKLLKEYEVKIQTYEELFKKVSLDTNVLHKVSPITNSSENSNEVINILNGKIVELDTHIKQKDNDITLLKNEIDLLKNHNGTLNSKRNENELLAKISELEQVLSAKNGILAKQNEGLMKRNNDEIETQIKTIMNNTFQTISANFDSGETYSGASIKNIIATVIKNITMESLNKS